MSDENGGRGASGFPGVQSVQMVDEVNEYVLTLLKPWTVWQPGLWQAVTNSLDQTYTNAEFDALNTGLSRTAAKIRRGTYDAQRAVWTYN